MFWKPVHSPQSQSYLKNSRLSERSTAYEQSRVSTSFEFDSSFQELKMTNPATAIRPRITERKRRSTTKDDPCGRYLTRVIMNRMINVRLALKEMEKLPTQLLQTGPGFAVAKAIVLKTRLNIETSVLRTLLFAQADGQPVQERMGIERGQNVFVLPSKIQGKGEKESKAILQLVEILRGRINWAVKQFQVHWKGQAVVGRYFSKMCSNYEQRRQMCFLKMRLLPSRQVGVGKLKTTQLKLIVRMLSKKYYAKMGVAFTNMKILSWNLKFKQNYAARQMLTYARIRKQQALQQWLSRARQEKQDEKRAVQIEEEKLEALRRIVLRNYLKLFKEIGRRVGNLRTAAIRIGCLSKINEQKSLWRLLLSTQSPS